MTSLDLADIQGNVLRGFHMPLARTFVLGIRDSGAARAFLATLVSGDADKPQVTTAEDWGSPRPEYALTIGLTWHGLKVLGIPAAVLSHFPPAFTNGPAANAEDLGDVGPAAPEHWVVGGPRTDPAHLVVSLYAYAGQHLDHWTNVLRKLFADRSLAELAHFDATALPHDKVHFGYRDGIAQPRIMGAPGRQWPDMQPLVDPGEFLLGRGYTNHYHGNYLGNLPEELCGNATYAALRVIRQDVKAFEGYIELMGRRWGLDKEMIAAKLMGRWRNGNPLTLIPDQYDPTPLPPERRNNFDFAPGVGNEAYYDDVAGLRCPLGSHIRRLNPRSGSVLGIQYGRRIIRRAMPYGQPYDPHNANDSGEERGLVGFFICGDLETQFEYVLRTWANMDFATIGVKGTRDPILGAQPPDGGQFFLRTADNRDPIVLDNLPRLTMTRGSVYCLMPGIGGLKFLAGV